MVRNLLGELQNRSNPFAADYVDPDTTDNANENTDIEMGKTTEKPATTTLTTNPFQTFTIDEESSDDEQDEPLDFESSLAQFQEINDKIFKLASGNDRIRQHVQQYERSSTNSEIQTLHKQIQNEIDETRAASSGIGEDIQVIRKEIYDSSSADEDTTLNQYKRNQFHRCMKKYEEALESYQGEVEHFNQVRKKRFVRIAKTVGHELNEEELDDIMENPQRMQQVVQTELVSTELLENLSHLEETRDQMRNIEQGLKDLLEMWQEFNNLLELQQERVDSIEDNVAKAHKKVKHGTQMLEEAQESQQCARKNQCYIMLCCMLLMFLVFGGVGIGFLGG